MARPVRTPRSQETRAALGDAAARVFVERGDRGARVRHVAERAGDTSPIRCDPFADPDDRGVA